MVRSVLWLIWLGLLLTAGRVQAQSLDLKDPRWEFQGDVTRQTFEGRPALRFVTGEAIRRDVSFQDGTIEFDLAVSDHRAFAYLLFRMKDNQEHEELYLRPHKSNLPDAVQYAPVFRGVSNWQLYHGPGSTAAAAIPHGKWFPVKLVLQGNNLALFVGDVSRPQLVNRRLAREPSAGHIALRNFVTTDQDATGAYAMFSNLRLFPGRIDYDFGDTSAPPETLTGLVTKWDISAAFEAPALPISELSSTIRNGEWSTVPADDDGLVVLRKYRDGVRGDGVPALLARLRIESTASRTVPFNFGFSDTVTVFLNDLPLFAGDDSYSFNFPRRDGLIGLDQGTVFLPLREGTNELILAITDTFGGWGVMGQFPDLEGIQIHP